MPGIERRGGDIPEREKEGAVPWQALGRRTRHAKGLRRRQLPADPALQSSNGVSDEVQAPASLAEVLAALPDVSAKPRMVQTIL